MDSTSIKKQILAALNHAEADEGLYFQNLFALHEEEERPMVEGEQEEILDALKELIRDGLVRVDDKGENPIFFAGTN